MGIKKKKLALVMSLVMAVSMAVTACADEDDEDDDDSSSKKSSISVSSSESEASSDNDSSTAIDENDESGDDTSSEAETTATTTTTTAAQTEPLDNGDSSSTVTTLITDDSSKVTTTTADTIGSTELTAGDEGQPVIDFFKAMENNDEKLFEKAFPKGMTDVLNNYANEKHLFQAFRDSLVEDYGDNFTIDVKITQKEEMTAEELSEMNESLKKYYSLELNIAEGYSISADATIHGNGKDDDDTLYTYVGKVDGKWVMLNLF